MAKGLVGQHGHTCFPKQVAGLGTLDVKIGNHWPASIRSRGIDLGETRFCLLDPPPCASNGAAQGSTDDGAAILGEHILGVAKGAFGTIKPNPGFGMFNVLVFEHLSASFAFCGPFKRQTAARQFGSRDGGRRASTRGSRPKTAGNGVAVWRRNQ